MKQSRDEFFLKKCLALARKGCGLVSPNPMVGAVISKGNRMIGWGWHRGYGLPHAEVEALAMAGPKAKGATLYVNLEPCCHYGKTPPCTDAIIKAGIRKVVFSTIDPNPFVNGKSIRILESQGVSVRYGILEKESNELNETYFTYINKKRPFISLKWAMSVDGKIANEKGESKWITSDEARQYNRRLRFEYDAILTGINTIIRDDPLLDFCLPAYAAKKEITSRKRYYKIILDSNLRMPLSSRVLNTSAKLIIFTKKGIRSGMYPDNVELIGIDEIEEGLLDIRQVISHLYGIGVGKLLVEGGTKVLTSFWRFNLFDRIYAFIGARILGGTAVYPPLEGNIIPLDSGEFLCIKEVVRFSTDLLLVLKNVLGNN